MNFKLHRYSEKLKEIDILIVLDPYECLRMLDTLSKQGSVSFHPIKPKIAGNYAMPRMLHDCPVKARDCLSYE